MRSTTSTCLCLCILVGTFASAATLNFVPQKVRQPDGTLVYCYASGDEYQNRLHDAKDYTIVQDPRTGFYVYATLRGGALVPTSLRAGSADPVAAGLVQGLRIARRREGIVEANLRSVAAGPTTGIFYNLVLFVRFADDPEFTEDSNVYQACLNDTMNGASSVRSYYSEASYGQLSVQSWLSPSPVAGVTTSYQDSYNRSYFQPYNAVTNPGGYQSEVDQRTREQNLVVRAVSGIAAGIPAELPVDADADGNVDNVCIVIRGFPDGWSSLLWPHMTILEQDAFVNGKRIVKYNLHLEEAIRSDGAGVVCHEMFHSLGAPDLYHYSYDGLAPVFRWDIMATTSNPPQHMGAYMKLRYGKWLHDIPQIRRPGTYTLNALGSSAHSALRVATPHSESEYFIIEYRKREGVFESSLPGEGLLVYRISTNAAGAGNRNGPPDEVYVYRPGGTLLQNGSPANAFFTSDAGRTSFGDATDPQDFLSNGSTGGISISNIGTVGSSISFTVTMPLPPPPEAASPADRATDVSPQQPLLWHASPGAASYTLQLATDSLFASVVWQDSLLTDTLTVPHGLNYGTRYFWRLRASNFVGDGDYSAVRSFSVSNLATCSITMTAGWNMISAWTDPGVSGIDSILAPVASQLVLIKDGVGGVYWPAFHFNTIGTWRITSGYQVYLDSAATLPVRGVPLAPEGNPIYLKTGWNVVAYLRNANQPIAGALESISATLTIVKNNLGEVYWPAYGFNTIGSMKPGQGYLLYVRDADTLVYPPNGLSRQSLLAGDSSPSQVPAPVHYRLSHGPTGSSGILMVSVSSADDGDEVGVFDQSGKLLGAATVQGKRAVVTIWGRDESVSGIDCGAREGDTLFCARWSSRDGSESAAALEELRTIPAEAHDGSRLIYRRDGLWSARMVSGPTDPRGMISAAPGQYALDQNYPNPFNPSTHIRIAVAERQQTTVELYDVLGRHISTLLQEVKEPGLYTLRWEASDFPSGVYLCRMTAGTFTATRRMVLVK
jgi:M6 family metalloprotease-like protein